MGDCLFMRRPFRISAAASSRMAAASTSRSIRAHTSLRMHVDARVSEARARRAAAGRLGRTVMPVVGVVSQYRAIEFVFAVGFLLPVTVAGPPAFPGSSPPVHLHRHTHIQRCNFVSPLARLGAAAARRRPELNCILVELTELPNVSSVSQFSSVQAA